MSSLSEVLDRIGEDILRVLATAKEPMTQCKIYSLRTLKNYSEDGWSYALDKLERNHQVETVCPDDNGALYWKLKDPFRKHYIEQLQEFTKTKIYPD